MDMSEFDVILGMDWLTTHRVVIDCDCKRVTATHQMMFVLCFKGISTMLCPKSCTILGSPNSCRVGWQTLPWRTSGDKSWVYLE